MDSSVVSDKKQEITKTTWEYLLKAGLTKASIGELCRETKLSQSSLYHWFANKDDIWISAGKYGISKVVSELFDYTLKHVDDIRQYFDTMLDVVETYKYELRLAVQITTNPQFGESMRDRARDFRDWYDSYAGKLMEIFSCSYTQAETFIYSIIAFIIDYVIWDDRDKTQMLLDNLRERILEALDLK